MKNCIDLTNLKTFTTGKESFHDVNSLTLTSYRNFIICDIDLPKLKTIKTDIGSFFNTKYVKFSSLF